jgi:Reverse transcriptase (RNA-dependent DNA polymerase)
LSPFLFNLVADCLSKMIQKAKISGYIKGLGNFENDNLINLNFADDTLLFITADTRIIDVVKLLLIEFENLSGLKTNFTKSELVPLNLTSQKIMQYANILGCKISSLPINYLGVPLHWRKLNTKDWEFLISKVEQKLDN